MVISEIIKGTECDIINFGLSLTWSQFKKFPKNMKKIKLLQTIDTRFRINCLPAGTITEKLKFVKQEKPSLKFWLI